MSVLIEGISIVIRNSALKASYPGGLDAFRETFAERVYCSDADLSRFAVAETDLADEFIELLTSIGIAHISDGRCQDVAVLDEFRGIAGTCDWLCFDHHSTGIPFAHLMGSDPADAIVVPAGWTMERWLERREHLLSGYRRSTEIVLLGRDGADEVYGSSNDERNVLRIRREEWRSASDTEQDAVLSGQAEETLCAGGQDDATPPGVDAALLDDLELLSEEGEESCDEVGSSRLLGFDLESHSPEDSDEHRRHAIAELMDVLGLDDEDVLLEGVPRVGADPSGEAYERYYGFVQVVSLLRTSDPSEKPKLLEDVLKLDEEFQLVLPGLEYCKKAFGMG